MSEGKAFNRKKIVDALQALGAELTREGVRGEIFVVGGAAMAIAYSTRRVTKDVDAVFEPKSVIYEAAGRVAEQLGLPDDWLNRLDRARDQRPGGRSARDDRADPRRAADRKVDAR